MKAIAYFAAALLAVAAWGADPSIGTWKLNLDKSKYSPGPPPKSSTVTFSQDGEFIVSKSEGVNAKGEQFESSSRWKRDGQDYAITGSKTLDTMAVKRIDDQTTDFTYKKAGKVVSTTRTVVSKDGKTVTATSTGTNTAGKKYNNRTVYDKQ
jgi:hypothetical protein